MERQWSHAQGKSRKLRNKEPPKRTHRGQHCDPKQGQATHKGKHAKASQENCGRIAIAAHHRGNQRLLPSGMGEKGSGPGR